MATKPRLIFPLMMTTTTLIHMAVVNLLLNSWFSRAMVTFPRRMVPVFILVRFVQQLCMSLVIMWNTLFDVFAGSPVNVFEFIRPLQRILDYDLPKFTLDVRHALLLGRFAGTVYRTLLYPWLNSSWLPQPLILTPEVYKVGVTHYFTNLKAKEELGYVPMVNPQEGMSATISYWQERKRRALDGPTIYAWFLCVIRLTSLFAALTLAL